MCCEGRYTSLRQEKGRNIILTEEFPWKERAKRDRIPAWKMRQKGKTNQERVA